MPFIHVELLKGRAPEQHGAFIRAVSEAAVRDLGATMESVRIVLVELDPDLVAHGNRTMTEIWEASAAEQTFAGTDNSGARS